MALFDQATTSRAMAATVLLFDFQVRCQLKVLGTLQTFINDEQRTVFPLYEAQVNGLRTGNPAASMSLPEMYVSKYACEAVAFHDMPDQADTGLMPRVERAAVYTGSYVFQGNFHMGADTRISEFVEASKAMFFGATDITIFPLFEAQAQVVQQAPLIYIMRDAVRMHHRI